MIEKGHVYLLNNAPHDAIVSLEFPVSYAAPTLRRHATQNVCLVIPHGRLLDVTKRLGMDRDEALQVLAQSVEVRRFGQLLSVVDGDTKEDEVTERLTKAHVDAAIHNAMQQTSVALSTHSSAIQEVQVSTSKLWAGQEVKITYDEKTGKQQAEVSPIPTVQEKAIATASEEMPSIAWPRQKLVDKAVAMGLEVNATMSKAAVLRKIRGA